MVSNIKLTHNPAVRWIVYALVAMVVWVVTHRWVQARDPYNGFDLSSTAIPNEQIHHGGPPRDGIPALVNPRFIEVGRADYLADDDRVLGLVRNGEARAYPLRILNYHEIVNDRIGSESLLVTYCPLCGTGVAFSAVVGGRKLEFGVSGLLFNSDLLLYDRQSDSLWSQISGEAVAGPMVGSRLQRLALTHTSWADWRRRYPDTLALDVDTGYFRDYNRGPYAGYGQSEDIYFPIAYTDKRYHPKEQVIGLEINGEFRAYPFVELSRLAAADQRVVREEFAGQRVRVEFDSLMRTGQVSVGGKIVPTITGYWFAWVAFHPETSVYQMQQ